LKTLEDSVNQENSIQNIKPDKNKSDFLLAKRFISEFKNC